MRIRILFMAFACILLNSSFFSGPLEAQEKQVKTPNGVQIALLIKSTLMALNQANQTGNYTVLRDLGTPSFQQNFSAARLTDSFKTLRDRRLNLNPILLKRPALTRSVEVSENGILTLEGFMPTDPLSIRFKMYFQYERKDWRLAGLAVDTIPLSKLRPAVTSNRDTKPSASDVTAAVPRTGRQDQKAAEEKTVTKASPPPARKPEIKRDAAAAKDPQTTSKVENRTSNNAVRIDLSKPQQQQAGAESDKEAAKPPSESGSSLWRTLNPFSQD